MVDLVTAIRSVRAEMNIPPATLTPLVLAARPTETKARAQRWNDVIKRLSRLADISFADAAPEGAVQLLVRGEVAALPLKGVIDLAAERTRLEKEIGKADGDIKRVDAKLCQRKVRRQRAGRDRRGREGKARGRAGAQDQAAGSARAAEEGVVRPRVSGRDSE